MIINAEASFDDNQSDQELFYDSSEAESDSDLDDADILSVSTADS